ncbi:hypothetical protein MA16_Dca013700 [Dendrobium catenatum]|uniref:Uncharacterized protein n=1 Tax=Dendrobium catenatum TaxID=906689 RepID=A0A2I0WPI4_9ASPA|nr:hypothetical protein MA16_Dca013700 [Dendrobium catenatum]
MAIGDRLDNMAAIGGLQDGWTAAMDVVNSSNEGRDSSSAPGIVLDSNQTASKKSGQRLPRREGLWKARKERKEGGEGKGRAGGCGMGGCGRWLEEIQWEAGGSKEDEGESLVERGWFVAGVGKEGRNKKVEEWMGLGWPAVRMKREGLR